MSEQEQLPLDDDLSAKSHPLLPKSIRRNPSGSYKLRIGIYRGPNTCKKYVSFGLRTHNPIEALERANFIMRCLRLAGSLRGEMIHQISEDAATKNLNKLEEEKVQAAADMNRMQAENNKLKATLHHLERENEILKKKHSA